MSQVLKVKCIHRFPPADRTEPGNPTVKARLEGELDGTIAKIEVTTTDPLVGAYLQVGKHYELLLQLDQAVTFVEHASERA